MHPCLLSCFLSTKCRVKDLQHIFSCGEFIWFNAVVAVASCKLFRYALDAAQLRLQTDRAIASYGQTEKKIKTKQKSIEGKMEKRKMPARKKNTTKEKRLRQRGCGSSGSGSWREQKAGSGIDRGTENCLQSGGCAHMGRAGPSVWLT